MRKLTLIILLTSFSYSHTASEYSLGLSDKLGFYGVLTKTWIYEKEQFDYYFLVGEKYLY